jgi:hypothetical protein
MLSVMLAAPLSASAAMLGIAVPRLPAAPLAVLSVPLAPAAFSASLPAPLAMTPAALAATPSAFAAPAAAIALLPAAADSSKFPEDPNAPAGKAAPPSEADAASAGASFDGSAPAAPAAPSIPAAPAAPPGSGLKMAKEEHEEWLAAVVGLLSGTRTGRRVLRDIDALAASRGRPLLLDVKPIGNNGEFRYDSDIVVMDSKHLKNDPLQSAPILAHELQHVLQRAMDLPADALELEIESYTVESRVWSELGVEPEPRSFARQARRRLAKGLPGFVEWLQRQYKSNIALYGSNVDAYVAKLQENLAKADRAEAKTRRKRAAVERVLESMRANGMSEEAVEAHRREDLEPLDRSLRDGAVNRAWIERDLYSLTSPEGRARFIAYSRGVIRRARSLSSAR